MSHYRNIDVKIWNDEKFLSLSEEAAFVFFHLLSHPEMKPYGAMRGTVEGLSSEFPFFSSERYAKGFKELLDERLIIRSGRGCFLRIKNFLKYNPPPNPNTLKNWLESVYYLPECPERIQLLKDFKPFAERFGIPLDIPLQEPYAESRNTDHGTRITDDSPLIAPLSTQTSKTEKAKAKNKTSSEEEFILPEDIPEASWNVWMEHRKKKRATNSTYAKTLLVRKLREISSKTTIPIPSLIDTAILRNWTGIEEDWITKGGSHVASNGQNGSRPKTFREIDEENQIRAGRRLLSLGLPESQRRKIMGEYFEEGVDSDSHHASVLDCGEEDADESGGRDALS